MDVGFTNYSSAVTQNYLDNFIPKALAVAEELRAENSEEKYVWTVGSWLIWKYLQKATLEETERLTKAISAGDIVWNGVPYTVESEVMNKEMFESSLLLAKNWISDSRNIRLPLNDRCARTYKEYYRTFV